MYLLLHNAGIRDVIETVSNKGVLLIGRLTGAGSDVLRAIREELALRHKLIPITFEFAPVPGQETARTLMTLAHLCRFAIADLTDAQSVLQELTSICLTLPSMPVQPLLREGAPMPPYRYSSRERLLADLGTAVIGPAEDRARLVEVRLAEIRRLYLPWQRAAPALGDAGAR